MKASKRYNAAQNLGEPICPLKDFCEWQKTKTCAPRQCTVALREKEWVKSGEKNKEEK